MKKIIIIFLAALLSKNTDAQLIINLQLPQVGLKLKSQLWDMTLVNTGNAAINIKINMLMTDLVTGLPVISATTNLIALPQGTKLIQYATVIPVTYTVLNSNYTIDASPNGLLPIGNFTVCFEVLKHSGEIFESMAEECTDIEVEPLSPPYLTMPGDQSEIDQKWPLFTWLPPTPVSLFNNLTYDLKLVEELPNQNSSDAIQQNLPVIFQQNINGQSFQYPLSITGLDTGKTYAWQITAKNNGLFIAKSEVWTFKEIVFGMDNITYQRVGAYFRLKRDLTSAYFLCDDVLKFAYTDESGDSLAPVKIYDITNKNKLLMNLDSNTVKLKLGLNLLKIDLNANGGFTSGHLYLIQLFNSRKETWYGRFEYKPNNN